MYHRCRYFRGIELSTLYIANGQEADDRHSVEMESLVEQVRVCEAVLGEERRQHALTQSEVTRLNQELEECKESLLREKTTTAEVLKVSMGSVCEMASCELYTYT